MENFSGGVAVLEREEEKEKSEKEMAVLAERYLSFNNHERELENDLTSLLGKINSLEETSSSLNFLKGQLYLELYDIYKNNEKKEKNNLTDNLLEQANESFLESIEGENFEIVVKNKEGQEMSFANKSHSFAYLGDIAVKDFYESGHKADWNRSLKYYQEAIKAEPDEGKKHELKIIMNIRKITHYLGDENKLEVWKTPRRIDLRKKTADFSLKYITDKKGTINKYIDGTKHMSEGKKGKQEWSETGILQLNKEIADFLAETDFDVLLEEVGRSGDLSEKNKKRLSKVIDYCREMAEKLEETMTDEIKSSEKLN